MSPHCKLLIIRHAETDMTGTFCGHSDPPVNACGHAQIKALTQALKTQKIDALYTSDLQRARTTANAFATKFALSPTLRPALREIDFGAWEGHTWSSIEGQDKTFAHQWINAYPNLTAPGGEPFAAFRTRVLAEFEKICTTTSHQHAAIVTHAGVMRVILQNLCGIDEQAAFERTKAYCSFFEYPDIHSEPAAGAHL